MSSAPTDQPSWLTSLARDHAGWSWLDTQEVEDFVTRMTQRYAGRGPAFVPLQKEVVYVCQRLIERLVPVATIPTTPRRPDVVPHLATVLIEKNAPEHVIICVHEELPPLLWFPAGQTLESVSSQMTPYTGQDPAPAAVDMPMMHRGFIGTPGILEMSRDELLAHWSTSPLAESLFWGSAHLTDPWPSQISAAELPELSEQAAHFLAQHPDAPWGVSFRAIASRSILGFEDHDGLLTLQFHYTPAGHAPLIAALNAQFGYQWPLDLPVDVCALLIGLHYEESDQIMEFIDESSGVAGDADELIFNLYALASVMHGDLSFVETLRPLLSHPSQEVREAIADIALRHNLDFLLLWMLEREPETSPLHHAILQRLQ